MCIYTYLYIYKRYIYIYSKFINKVWKDVY